MRLRCLVAEFIGAFILIFTDAGLGMISKLYPTYTYADRAMAAGLVILALIFMLGGVSGAHFNPAVTVKAALLDPRFLSMA
jgi:glycerol uptake facilitator-like aquaporin